MRRRSAILALPVLLGLLPASPAEAACVSSSGVTVCPTIYTCGPLSVVQVTVVGLTGSGTASCGGGVADCYAFQVGCTAIDTASSRGVLTCASTGRVVATCTVTLAAT